MKSSRMKALALAKKLLHFLVQALCLLSAQGVLAADWSYQVESSTRSEYFNNNDDMVIYSEEGTQSYTDLRVNTEGRFSAFSTLTTSALLYGNDSAYRDSESGMVLGNANVQWENGEVALPFRLQAGDFLGQYSLRTLQRSLKGVQLELQPNERHSILLSSGAFGQRYDDFDADRDLYSGLSWTYSPWVATTFGINWVKNEYEDTGVTATNEQIEQEVSSVFLDSKFLLHRHQLGLEMELAKADPMDTNNPNNNEKQNGMFTQLSGRGKNIDYRLRFEDNDEFFAPRGGSAAADRRNREVHLGYRFPARVRLNLRGQQLDSNRSSNRLRTEVVGLRLGLPLAATAVDAFVQTQRDAGGTLDSELRSLSLNFGSQLTQYWSWRGGFSARDNSDDITAQDSESRQYNLALARRFRWGRSGSGSVDVGVAIRDREDANGNFDETGPSIGWTLQTRQHQWQLRYAALNQNAGSATTLGSFNTTASLRYRYSSGPHELSVEAEYQSREPDNADVFAGTRGTLSYRFRFDGGMRGSNFSGGGATSNGRRLSVHGVAIGQLVSELGDLGSAIENGEWLIFEEPIFSGVASRQRLAVRASNEYVLEAAVLIDTGSADMESLLSEVLRELTQVHGQPDLILEEGDFSNAWQSDLVAGNLLRTYEWQGSNGTLRLGLPISGNGENRIEIRLAPRLNHPRDPHWGIEEY